MSAAIAIFTRVFPAKMVVRHRRGFSMSLMILDVSLPPWPSLLILMESKENRAVSEAEKKAEKDKKTTSRPNLRITGDAVMV